MARAAIAASRYALGADGVGAARPGACGSLVGASRYALDTGARSKKMMLRWRYAPHWNAVMRVGAARHSNGSRLLPRPWGHAGPPHCERV